ncbi:vanadium-dependent haloperoxidase [Pseudanabaena sp. PCC 6802]|uniref:vanadium-dependent haloperoxidase n=1 Tax=Pseudanabaena sp. PCC 6802 TaxID=118173 RepID=UPI00038235D7|nr:vanadium-dependent haloperoxidase [Pseudanabaena sp. PCC 6802]
MPDWAIAAISSPDNSNPATDSISALNRNSDHYPIQSYLYPYLDTPQNEGTKTCFCQIISISNRILINLYPNQAVTFDTARQKSLDLIPDSFAKSDGIQLGETVADRILTARSRDGSKTQVSYLPQSNPGDWQPTPSGFLPALLPQWPNVTPFAMTSGSQFRPSGPPTLSSDEYAADFNQVKAIGAKNSPLRTPEQTEIAQFWSDAPGTYTPPGHWNQIAAEVAAQSNTSLVEEARLFALLNIALADAGIAAWDAKYAYEFWRPVNAIRQADLDNNPQTVADTTWDSLIATPPFPEYVSGHSTFSGAADAILTNFFGDNIDFTATSIGLPGVSRSYSSFATAADEAGMSRIYGGIHFLAADVDGLNAGRALGNYVFDNFLEIAPPL